MAANTICFIYSLLVLALACLSAWLCLKHDNPGFGIITVILLISFFVFAGATVDHSVK